MTGGSIVRIALKRFLVSIVLLIGIFISSAYAQKSQDKATFPSDEEITLMATQADRAMKEYETNLNQAKQLLGNDKGWFDQDRKVLEAWGKAKKLLGSRPQAFNTVAGFNVVTILDDASRNSALLANEATMQVTENLTSGNSQGGTVLITLASNANTTSTLLYMVSENAAALYERFLRWQQQTLTEAVDSLDKCGSALKLKLPPR